MFRTDADIIQTWQPSAGKTDLYKDEIHDTLNKSMHRFSFFIRLKKRRHKIVIKITNKEEENNLYSLTALR